MSDRLRFIAPPAATTLFIATLVALAACGKKTESPQTEAAASSAASTESPLQTEMSMTQTASSPDPCSLLEPAEVAAVLGPLAGAPYRGSEEGIARSNGAACIYETPDFRTLVLEPTWSDGSTAMAAVALPGRMLNDVHGDAREVKKSMLPGGVQIDGEWDEAQSMGCCRIFALRGDALIAFDYEGWKNDTPAAVGLLNKALLRLDKPLGIDGNAGVPPAIEREQSRPKPRAACDLVSRAEAEAIVGPLLADPTNSRDGSSCTYRFNIAAATESPLANAPEIFKGLASSVLGAKGGLAGGPLEAELTVRWSGGFRHLVSNGMIAGAMRGMTSMPGIAAPPALDPGEGTWSEATQSSLAFVAVKKDVAVTVPTAMLPADTVKKLRRLVAKAIEKI